MGLWKAKRGLSLIRQAEASECGLACLAMVANHHGHELDLVGLRQRFAVSLTGLTLSELMSLAASLGFTSRALRLEPAALSGLAAPLILHWDLDHFVVLAKLKGDKATIYDPARGRLTPGIAELAKHFTGVALELRPAAQFKPIAARRRARLADFWSRAQGLGAVLAQTFLLSLMLQLIVLTSPYYLQLAIDEVLPGFDHEFLLMLTLGFGGLYVIRAGTECLRGWVVLNYGQQLSFQMAGNLFHHLIRLPADFFEKRHVGDIVTRLESIAPIQRALTQGFVAALIDGIMAITTGLVMLVYDWRLALIAFAFIAAYLLISVSTLPLRRTRQADEIAARAREQSHQIETLRAARAIKQFGRETIREAAWRNLLAKVIDRNLAVGRLDLLVSFAQTLLWGLQITVVVHFAITLILAGEFTVGALFAFTAYRQHFVERMQDLVATGIEFGMLKLHLERLADIVHAERERHLEAPAAVAQRRDGGIELCAVSFRYGQGDTYVLRGLSLAIEPGMLLAITGPSGGGKSTLLKILLGLLKPERGELRVHGLPLAAIGLKAWRAETAAVMQDDQLLSGTIADNIACFDPDIDMQAVQRAAAAACVHTDIMQMPMNYLSLVGDMGSALSGGQKQRVLLARALYRRPRVLLLDEGTAHLDAASERMIADTVADLTMTRVVIAHRPALLRRADRVLVLDRGCLTDLPRGDAIPSDDMAKDSRARYSRSSPVADGLWRP